MTARSHEVRGIHDFVVKPGDHLKYLVYDHLGTSHTHGAGLPWRTQRWPSNASSWFAEGLHIGYSSPVAEAPVAAVSSSWHVAQVCRLCAAPDWFGRVETLFTATPCEGELLHHWWNRCCLLKSGPQQCRNMRGNEVGCIRQVDPRLGRHSQAPAPCR